MNRKEFLSKALALGAGIALERLARTGSDTLQNIEDGIAGVLKAIAVEEASSVSAGITDAQKTIIGTIASLQPQTSLPESNATPTTSVHRKPPITESASLPETLKLIELDSQYVAKNVNNPSAKVTIQLEEKTATEVQQMLREAANSGYTGVVRSGYISREDFPRDWEYEERTTGRAYFVVDSTLPHHMQSDEAGFQEARDNKDKGFYAWMHQNAARFGMRQLGKDPYAWIFEPSQEQK